MDKLTVALFQANAAIGTCKNPQNINNDIIGTPAASDVIGEYAEVEFDDVMIVNQFRQHGHSVNDNDGEFKIQYFDLATETWTDAITGIATRGESWSGWVSFTAVYAKKVRVTCTVVDGSILGSKIREIEMKGDVKVIYFTQTQNEYMLPQGDYEMIARMKHSADASDNIATLWVYNVTDPSEVSSCTKTLTTNYKTYTCAFTIDSLDDGDSIEFGITKEDVSGNVRVDYLGFVAEK